MSEKKSDGGHDLITALGIIIGTISVFFAGVIYKGIIRRKTWTKWNLTIWYIYLLWLSLIVYGPRGTFSAILHALSPAILPLGFVSWVILHVPKWAQVGVLFLMPFCLWLFLRGIGDWIAVSKSQRAIDHLGFKTFLGVVPKVLRVIDQENYQRKILVLAAGIDVAEFKARKGALESSLNTIVQDIRVTKTNRQIFEILVSDKELPTLIRFDEVSERLSRPYTFLVGTAMDGFIVADLCELHHMLVAGATGGGKSVFFKQALIGLLKSSKYIQLYLIDLKRGVDMKPFEALENVQVLKETLSAISTLTVIVGEMERRFKYLEKSGYTEIVPERDRLDRIVVGIDEASVLFTVEKSSQATKQQAYQARELVDKLAKLGRAAGIHVILATQKVIKETIDTRVQTNINARMCFRVNTVASSMTVLGNKMASELPDIKGRGVWSVGSNDIIVQVPKLSNEEVIEEVGLLAVKFNGSSRSMMQPMLTVPIQKTNRGHGGFEDTENEPSQDDAERSA